MKNKTKKYLFLAIIGNYFGLLILLPVGVITLSSSDTNHYMPYGILTTLVGFSGIIIVTFLRSLDKTKKNHDIRLRRIIAISSLASILIMILALSIFTPQLSFSLIGGIIGISLLVIGFMGSLLSHKKEHINIYKK